MGGNVLHERSGMQGCSRIVRVYDKLGERWHARPVRVESAIALPLTFAAWCGIGLEHYKRTGELPAIHVQVQKRGVKLCGRVLEAAPAREGQDTDWFKVDCYLGQLWFAHTNVRQCSGLDGRCHCAATDAAPAGTRACAGASGASTVPPGNTGTTVGVKA